MAGFLLLLVANLLIGAGAMHLIQLWLRGKTRNAAGATLPEPAPTDAAAKPPKPNEQMADLTGLMRQIEGNLSRHSFEVREFSDELKEMSCDDPALVVAAAASMLIANRRLQSELAIAQEELERHRRTVDELSAELRIDPLTGLANRRCFDEEMERRLDMWRRYKVPFCVLLIDIDRFKQVNDQFGHPAGDTALKWLGRVLPAALRRMDIASRYGGEEFAILLPASKLSEAGNVGERLRGTIAAKPCSDIQPELPITVSVGVAMTIPEDEAATVLKRADEALYAAKENGRNRAFLHDGTTTRAIEPDRALVRHPFDTIQQVAEYYGGTEIPPASAFAPMRASDISAKGISLLCDEPPECKAFVVRLGMKNKPCHMVAKVAFVAPLETEPMQYCVGCSFVARLDSEQEESDEVDVSLEELVTC